MAHGLQNATFNRTNWSDNTKACIAFGATLGVIALVVGVAMGAGAFGNHLSYSTTEPIRFHGVALPVAETLTVIGGVTGVAIVIGLLAHHVHKKECMAMWNTLEGELKINLLELEFDEYKDIIISDKLYRFSKIGSDLEMTFIKDVDLEGKITKEYSPFGGSMSDLQTHRDIPSQLRLDLLKEIDSLTPAAKKRMQKENIPFYANWVDESEQLRHIFVWHDGTIAEATSEAMESFNKIYTRQFFVQNDLGLIRINLGNVEHYDSKGAEFFFSEGNLEVKVTGDYVRRALDIQTKPPFITLGKYEKHREGAGKLEVSLLVT